MSEPARVIGRINESVPWGITESESRIEHCARTALDAIADLHVEVWAAQTRGELGLLLATTRTLIAELDIIETTAITLSEHFDSMRTR